MTRLWFMKDREYILRQFAECVDTLNGYIHHWLKTKAGKVENSFGGITSIDETKHILEMSQEWSCFR
jgi:hypothetical protein